MPEIKMCDDIEYMYVEALNIHPKNPRTISRERLEDLKTSIKEKGFYEPIIVWTKGNFVLSGNHRLLAVRELCDEGHRIRVLPVILKDIPEEMANAILFEANNHYSEWDNPKLIAMLDETMENYGSLDGLGFTTSELDRLLSETEKEVEESIAKMEDEVSEYKPEAQEPMESTKLRDALPEEEYATLTMPRHIYDEFVGYLSKISKAMNEDWRPGDAYTESLQALNQLIRESKMVEELVEHISD